MTENSGREEHTQATTDAADDARLGTLIRGLTDDAEQLITLNGRPEAVRERALRRRNRRRAGAATTLVGGAALAVGIVWGVLPYAQEHSDGPTADRQARGLVSAAAILPAAQPDGKLTEKALLSPSALPWNSTYHWQTTATGRAPATPLPETGRGDCRVQWFEDLKAMDVVARTYNGQARATAQHRIAAFAGPSEASKAAEALNSRLRQCGWHETRVTGTPSPHGDASSDGVPDDLHEYVLTSGPDDPVRVTLVQSDSRVAVLAVSTPVAYAHAHPDSRTDACLDESLRNDSTVPSSSPQPTHAPEHC
ncbi:hypothetical protein ABZ214_34790 [Streptomyces iakyrus]|uniref:hypothetical protein n=1 Tax=Streptomyces iakyrus TaxID=68219 RepID=UPI0033A8782A